MAEAVILKDRNIVKKTTISDVKYYLDGFVSRFKYKNAFYIYCSNEIILKKDRSSFKSGYYIEDEYLNYIKGTKGVNIDKLKNSAMKTANYQQAETGDTIVLEKLDTNPMNVPEVIPNKLKITWELDLNINVLSNDLYPTILIPKNEGDQKKKTVVIVWSLEEVALNFYSKNIGSILNSPKIKSNEHDNSVIHLVHICVYINNIIRRIFPIFVSEIFNNIKEKQILEWSKNPLLQSDVSYKDLLNYESGLYEYYNFTFQNQKYIKQITDENIQLYYLLLGLSAYAIKIISPEFRVKVLDYIILTKLSQNTERISDENLAIKIISSYDGESEEIVNSFLLYLKTSSKILNGVEKTTFEILYDSMSTDFTATTSLISFSNWAFGTNWKPDKTKEGFIKVIYTLWIQSRYNPYDEFHNLKELSIGLTKTEGDTKYYRTESVINTEEWTATPNNVIHNYTPYSGISTQQIVSSGEVLTTIHLQGDKNASPVVLNYVSQKSFGFYNTNYDFKFVGKKIEVSEQFVDIVKQNPQSKNLIHGTYSIFQPVSIINSTESETSFPINSEDGQQINVNGDNINAFIPIFLLKFIDDDGFRKNIELSIGLTFDVLLTFSGIGNLAKLKHLSHLSKLKNVFTLLPHERILLIEAVSGINAVVEITAGVASTISTYIDSNDCSDPEFCESLKGFLTILELASLSSDFVLKNRLRNQAQKVLDNVPENGWPIDFIDDLHPDADVRAIIQKVGNISELIDHFRQTRLVNKPNLLAKFDNMTDAKKREFFSDFNNQNDIVLNQLNENSAELTDLWGSLKNGIDPEEKEFLALLNKKRRDITFLKDYKFVTNNSDLLEHALEGNVYIYRVEINGVLGNTKVDLTGNHNPHEIIIPPPYIEGKWHYKDGNYIENSLKYRRGRLERYMIENDPQTGERWINNNSSDPVLKYMKSKKDMSVSWPLKFSIQRIKLEMTIAFSNKNLRPSKKTGYIRYEGEASDGMKIIINRDPSGKWSIYPDINYNF